MTMLLSDLCADIQEEVCSYLSTRDLLSLSSCCWAEVGQRVLRTRESREEGVTVISLPAPYLTCRLELNIILDSFLSQLGLHNPALALLHIPTVFDVGRSFDISTIFPRHTAVIKCMDSLFGSSRSLSHQELQALLMRSPSR